MSRDTKTDLAWEALEAARQAEADRQAAREAVRMLPDTAQPARVEERPIALPGVDQALSASLHERVETDATFRRAFRVALFSLGKSEQRRRPLSPAERVRRRAAGRRSRVARRITRAAA